MYLNNQKTNFRPENTKILTKNDFFLLRMLKNVPTYLLWTGLSQFNSIRRLDKGKKDRSRPIPSNQLLKRKEKKKEKKKVFHFDFEMSLSSTKWVGGSVGDIVMHQDYAWDWCIGRRGSLLNIRHILDPITLTNTWTRENADRPLTFRSHFGIHHRWNV